MQSRRDQVQAHTFVAGRLVSAMLRAEPDAPSTPLRRFTVGIFCGVMAGIILIAGFGIFGYIKPGGKKAFREPGALIVEKETGARYVLVDGQLRPVLNFASAKLILGDDLRVVSTSRNSMKGVPHGQPVGIPSAPDYLPDRKDLDATGWQVCSGLKPDVSGEDKPFVTLRIGGGSPAWPPLGEAEGVIVATSDGTRYLAWNNRRLRIPSGAILGALGYGTARVHLVGPAFVNALPAGPDLEAPGVPGRGDPGPEIGGVPTLVGQLFEVQATVAQKQFFLVTRDGLAPLTPTGAALVLGDVRSKKAYPGVRVAALALDPAALAAAPRSDQALLDPGLPVTPPQAVSDTGSDVPCLQITVGGTAGADVRVMLAPAGPAPALAGPARGLTASVGGNQGEPGGPSRPVDQAVPAAPDVPAGLDVPTPRGAGAGLADQITVEPGSGLLIRALPGPGVTDGAQYLLVDTGIRYPLPTADVAGTLGYGEVDPIPVPTPLLGLVPAGRPLEPSAAKATLPVALQTKT